MIPKSVAILDKSDSPSKLAEGVQQLSIADVEALSITDISALETSALKDLLNDAVRNRLAQHLGGTYTSAPKLTVRQLAEQTGT